MTHVIEPNAAGIDVGSTEMFVAVPVDRGDPQPVPRFTTFTRDLVGLADWLKQCGVTSDAMESTGVFWIPSFQLLDGGGEILGHLGGENGAIGGVAPWRAAANELNLAMLNRDSGHGLIV